MSKIDIVDKHIAIEIRTHEPDPYALPAWSYADLTSGRVNWGIVRNSRYANVIPKNTTS